jgi:hypothetical protein
MSFTVLPLLIILGAIAVVLLTARARRPHRRLRMILACALLLLGALFFLHWERPCFRSGRQTAVTVPLPPTPPWLPPPVALEVPSSSKPPKVVARDTPIAIDLGDLDLSDLGGEWDAFLPELALHDGLLRISGDARYVQPPCEAHADPAAETPADLRAALSALTQRVLSEKLARYFDELVGRSSPALRIREVRDLHDSLKSLTVTQRAQVAKEAAQLHDIVTRYEVSISSGENATAEALRHYAIEAYVQPERILQLAQAKVPEVPRGAGRPPSTAALAAIGVIAAAGIILKLAARRHAGPRPQ